jgi:RNA polymerase sigma-70 factor (ECF subfamily)
MLKSVRAVVSATANQVFAGHQIDFEGAISCFSPMLFRVALRRLRNVEDAEDAVQDAVLSAYKHLGQFEGRSQLSTWLTTIVSNVALMKLRRYSRRKMLSLDQEHENDGTALASKLKDTKPNPENLCAQSEMDEKLRRALNQLSPKQRSAIQMCELDGFSTREAATALGISTNTLKSRVSRARGNLGVLLRDVSGTRRVAEAAPVVDRKGAERRGRSSSARSEASVPVFGRNQAHIDAQPHMERTPNCYPPHSLENATYSQPHGYAT